MKTFLLQHDWSKSQPRVGQYKPNSIYFDGIQITGETAKEAVDAWNESQLPGHRLNPFYLKVTEIKKNPREKIVDEQAAHELYLFAVNDSGLYRQRILPIIANLQKKIKRGVYDPTLALKLWKYAADDAAQRYTKEFGEGKGYGVFTPATRRETAAHLADHYMEHVKENPLSAHARAVMGKNPKPRTHKRTRKGAKRGDGMLNRIVLQAKFSDSLIGWVTVHAWDNTPANLREAIAHGKTIHKRNPSLPLRVIKK